MPHLTPSPVLPRGDRAVDYRAAAVPPSPQVLAAAPLSVERIDTAVGFAGLCREWDALLDRSGEPSPFLTWEWLYPWWQHIGRGNDLYLLTVRNGSGRLVGLAPLFRSWTGLGRWDRCRRLAFLGTGKAASDYLNMIIDPAEGCAVLAALVEYLIAHREEWDVLSLTDVDEKAWSVSMLRTAFLMRGFKAIAWDGPGSACRYARLDDGWESYLRSRCSNVRRQMIRKAAVLEEQYDAGFTVIEQATEISQAMDDLVVLHRGRWAALQRESTLADDSMVAFLRSAAALLHERGWLRMCAVVSRGRPLAILYGLAYRGTFYDYQKGMDMEWSRWGVGSVLQGWCIRRACEEGLTECDLLRGDEPYKDRWAPYVRNTIRLDIVQQRPQTAIYRSLHRLVHGFREVRRRLRGPGTA